MRRVIHFIIYLIFILQIRKSNVYSFRLNHLFISWENQLLNMSDFNKQNLVNFIGQQQYNKQLTMLKTIGNCILKRISKKGNQTQKSQQVKIQMSSSSNKIRIIKWKDGTTYIGQCQGQLFEGEGKIIFSSGDFYEGAFLKGNFHGQGKYVSYDQTYEGEWENGLKNGYGKEISIDGSSFVGKYQKGLKEGVGIYSWPDGSVYQGMFKEDKMHGSGKLINSDGSQIQAEWKENSINGIARQKDRLGFLYIGFFQNGIRHGRGKLIKKNEIITGVWIDGTLEGPLLIDSKQKCTFAKAVNDQIIQISDQQFHRLNDAVAASQQSKQF